MSHTTTPAATTPPTRDRWQQAAREIVGGGVGISVLAVLLALLVGAVLIATTAEKVQETGG